VRSHSVGLVHPDAKLVSIQQNWSCLNVKKVKFLKNC